MSWTRRSTNSSTRHVIVRSGWKPRCAPCVRSRPPPGRGGERMVISMPIGTGAPRVELVDRLLAGTHPQPHEILGCHPHGAGIAVRALYPGADGVDVLFPGGDRVALVRVHPAGMFSIALPGPAR